MCIVFTFVMAHIVAWSALGGGWRGAARAPFAVFLPALAIILLDAVWTESFSELGLRVGTLASWEALYLFIYVCARLVMRPGSTSVQALPRR